jgi:3-oxoacyl-[acyl-carrier protein] reductase
MAARRRGGNSPVTAGYRTGFGAAIMTEALPTVDRRIAASFAQSGGERMAGNLEGHVALVTGAGSGMGRAHAETLATRGATVIAQDVFAGRGETVAEAIRAAGGKAEGMDGNAGDPADMRPRVEAALARNGKIDILVNNAGISGMQLPLLDIDEATFDRMMAVNVKAAFFLSQMVVPGMRDQRWGRIVNVSSMFAMKGSPDAAHYTAAKSALLGLTKALARELGPWNITVNAIAPGLVRTEMTRRSLGGDAEFEARAAVIPMRRLAEPVDHAYIVAFLASDEAALMTGQTLSANGGDAIVGI